MPLCHVHVDIVQRGLRLFDALFEVNQLALQEVLSLLVAFSVPFVALTDERLDVSICDLRREDCIWTGKSDRGEAGLVTRPDFSASTRTY